jgi:hypothetical protein
MAPLVLLLALDPPSASAQGGVHRKVSLSAAVTAIAGRKGVLSAQFTSWRPTIVVTIPAAAAAGTYTGVITHSVAPPRRPSPRASG